MCGRGADDGNVTPCHNNSQRKSFFFTPKSFIPVFVSHSSMKYNLQPCAVFSDGFCQLSPTDSTRGDDRAEQGELNLQSFFAAEDKFKVESSPMTHES